MKNFIFIFFTSLIFAGCGDDNCGKLYTLSEFENSFIPYEKGDSIAVTIYDKVDALKNKSMLFSASYYLNDTIFQHDALGINPCPNSYERIVLKFYLNENILTDNSTLDKFTLTGTFTDNEFGFEYFFRNNEYSDFRFLPFDPEGENAILYEKKQFNGIEYKDVYLLIDTFNGTRDSLYISLGYGLIQLITKEEIYAFENLD